MTKKSFNIQANAQIFAHLLLDKVHSVQPFGHKKEILSPEEEPLMEVANGEEFYTTASFLTEHDLWEEPPLINHIEDTFTTKDQGYSLGSFCHLNEEGLPDDRAFTDMHFENYYAG